MRIVYKTTIAVCFNTENKLASEMRLYVTRYKNSSHVDPTSTSEGNVKNDTHRLPHMQGYRLLHMQGYRLLHMQGYRLPHMQGYRLPHMQGSNWKSETLCTPCPTTSSSDKHTYKKILQNFTKVESLFQSHPGDLSVTPPRAAQCHHPS